MIELGDIVNKKLVTLNVEKTWNDADNHVERRPESIRVRLYADGVELEDQVAIVKPDDDGKWKYKFEDLPAYKNGKEINYTISEDPVPGYLSDVKQNEDGTYTIELQADGGKGASDTLELAVTVSKEEALQSTFTSEYPEQQGASGTTFTFDTTIVNNRATEQSYALAADVPTGWQATFTPSGETTNVASLTVDAGQSQGVTVTVTPPDDVEKGDYSIPVTAISSEDNLSEDLSVSITGTYDVSLSTPDGRLSLDAYADKESTVTLSVTNNGNVDLTNLNLTSSAPTDWEVTFSESTIDTLEAGATKEITATIKPAQDVITGDYVTSISIKNDEASSSADLRVSVKTSTTWGIAAIAIIVVLVAVLGMIFKKFGRR